MMNERPNDYRKVPFAEHEGNHLFRVLRHFPELAKTMPEVRAMQESVGRNWVDQKKPGKEKAREISFRSTKRLDELKKSSHGTAGGQMDEMRKILLCSRNPVMAKRLKDQEDRTSRYLENGSLSTAPSMPNTPAAASSPLPGMQSGSYNMNGNGTVGLLEDSGKGPESLQRGALPGGGGGNFGEHGTSIVSGMGSAGNTPSQSHTGTTRLDKYGNDMSIDPLISANNKLAKASLSYAPSAELNILGGFQGQDLNEEEFDVQLRRCLQVALSKRELKAMYASMDADGSGLIDGVEFTRYFLTVGNIAREKVRLATLEKHRRTEHHNKMHALEEEQRIKEWEGSQISQETNAIDEERVFKRLAKIALHWDSNNPVSTAKLLGFDSYLTPFEFKLQLEASFDLHCDKDEMGALMHRYKTRPGEYCVDGKAFLQSFSKLRRASREHHAEELKKLAKRKDKVLQLGRYYAASSYQCLGR